MNVARILYPVRVLGPGERVGIWFCGCPRRCKGCSNPELWEKDSRYEVEPQRVYELATRIADAHPVDGITLTGGDPLWQAEEFVLLTRMLKEITDDILTYTGYTIDEIAPEMLENVGVLIDGPYIESRNTNCVLRGSNNQRIHVRKPQLAAKYDAYCATHGNEIQNFTSSQGIISVGIHRPGFRREFARAVKTRGLQDNG